MLRAATFSALLLFTACAHLPSTPAPPSAPLALGADLHIHVVMHHGAHPVMQGEPGTPGARAESPGDIVDNAIDLRELQRAGVRVLVASVWNPPSLSPWTTPLDQTLRQLRALRRWAGRHAEVALVGSAEQARAVAAGGRIALIPAVEAADGVTSVGDVDRLYAAGARELQLVHFVDDDLAGAASGQLSGSLLGLHGRASNALGLTPLGRQVVRRMLQLGMIIDLAHASDRAVAEVLDLADAAHVPVIDSHTGARALTAGERNLSDALATRLVASGGLLGVSVFRHQVEGVPEAWRFSGFVPGTCDDIVAHWLYLAKQVGPDALALGSDLNGFAMRPRAGGSCPDGIRGTQDLPVLFGALKAHGYPGQALDHMGDRLLELWKRVEAASAPAARAQASRADGEPDDAHASF